MTKYGFFATGRSRYLAMKISGQGMNTDAEADTLEFRINVHYVYSLFRFFSTLYALIRVYTFINYMKKVPTYTFIPAYTIILFASGYYIILSQLNRNYRNWAPQGQQPSWSFESYELGLKMFGPYAFVALKIAIYISFWKSKGNLFNLYFYFLPIRLLNIPKKFLPILLFGPSLSYTIIKFWGKFQPILLFRPVRLFGTLE